MIKPKQQDYRINILKKENKKEKDKIKKAIKKLGYFTK